MEMRRNKFVFRDPKSGTYKYKREYPEYLRHEIGKRWFVRSFGTTVLKEAERNYSTHHQEYEAILAEHDAKHRPVAADDRVYLEPLLYEYGIMPEAETLTFPLLLDYITETKRRLRNIYETISESGEDTHRVLPRTPKTIPAGELASRYENLLWHLENARRKGFGEGLLSEAEFKGALDDYLTITSLRVTAPILKTAPASLALTPASALLPANPRLKVSLIAKQWEEENSGKNPKNLADTRAAVRRFIEIVGDVELHRITRQMAKIYLAAMEKMPKLGNQSAQKLTYQKIMQKVESGEITTETIAENTLRKYRDRLAALVQYTRKKHDLEIPNMFEGILEGKAQAKFKREDFTTEQLQRFFSSPLYAGCMGKKTRHIEGRKVIRDALYWMPLVALYTGMRMEEIAQLHLSDIRKEGDFYVMSVSRFGEGKRKLKNESSERLVPLHPQLIKAGLLEYAEQQRALGVQRLFPELVYHEKEQRYGKEFSRMFNAYLAAIGMKPAKETRIMLDFHSFRHTCKSALRSAKDEEISDAITGHSHKSIGRKYGKIPIPPLYQTICAVHYEGLIIGKPPASQPMKKKKLRLRLTPSN